MKETNLGRVGLLLSAAYLAILIVGVCLSSSMGWIEWKALEINQLGDFLAGAFGPLALGWLVLGFFQQGRELKNSVETLRLQAQELKNSVEQQRKLVEATREQINFEKDQITNKSIPSFLVRMAGARSSSNGDTISTLKVSLVKPRYAKFSVSLEGDADLTGGTDDQPIEMDHPHDIRIAHIKGQFPDCILTINARTHDGFEATERFQLPSCEMLPKENGLV